MKCTIRADEKVPFSAAPESADAEIIQNIRLLLNTDKYDIPLAREMGRDTSQMGERIQVAEMREYQNILDLIEKYEPRAKVLSVEFDTDSTRGRLIPIVEVETSGG